MLFIFNKIPSRNKSIFTSKCSVVKQNLRCFSPRDSRICCNSLGDSKSSIAILNVNPVLEVCATK